MNEQIDYILPDLPDFIQVTPASRVPFHQPNQSKSKKIIKPIKISHYRIQTFLEHEISIHDTPGPGSYTKSIQGLKRVTQSEALNKNSFKIPEEVNDFRPFYNTTSSFKYIATRSQSPSFRQTERFSQVVVYGPKSVYKKQEISKFCNW